jgi:hypothetical protein
MMAEDVAGWGEASPLAAPTYSPEWAAGVFATMKTWLAPRLVGQEIRSGEQLQQILSVFKGNPFAKAGLDLAWWDLHARLLGQPLYQLLGGQTPAVPVGADFGVMDSVEQLLEKVGEALAEGFRRIKLTFRRGWDLPMVRAVRQAYPEAVLHIDCNSGSRTRPSSAPWTSSTWRCTSSPWLTTICWSMPNCRSRCGRRSAWTRASPRLRRPARRSRSGRVAVSISSPDASAA